MDMFLPVVSTENDDNEITIIEENIPTTPTIKRNIYIYSSASWWMYVNTDIFF